MAVSLALGVLLSALTALPFLDRLDSLDIDLLHALSGVLRAAPAAEPGAVAVVAIDERTYATPPFAGLPKVMWTPQIAAVQNAILDGGAKVIGWDVILPTSAATYVANKNFDQALLQSLARGRQSNRVVLGAAHIGGQTINPHQLFVWAAGGTDNVRPLNLNVDTDGIVRAIPTFLAFRRTDGNRVRLPTMAVEIAARLIGHTPTRTTDGDLRFGAKTIPGTGGDEMKLNFNGAGTRPPTFSIADLFQCAKEGRTDFFRRHFAGKAVLFGLVLDLEDRKRASNRFVTDGGPPGAQPRCVGAPGRTDNGKVARQTTPGVYIHAAAIGNLLNREVLLGFSRVKRVLISLPLVLALALAACLFHPMFAALALVAGMMAWTGFGAVLFGHALVLPLADPLVAAALSSISVAFLKHALVDRNRRFLRKAFSSYVAPALVETLLENPEKLRLGGERRELSFLFTDIAGFTGLIEGLDAENIGPVLNPYMDNLVQIAQQHGGTIDRVNGDAVVVIFSAPVALIDHAARAVACALAMDAFAQDYAGKMRDRDIPFGSTRIGVHTGSAIVGNFGGSALFDYTAHGDAMNVAARLESVNKKLGTRICVSADTAHDCADFRGRPVGHLKLKGRQQSIEAFEPVSPSDSILAQVVDYNAAYPLIEAGDPRAVSAIGTLYEKHPDDPLIRLYHNRLAAGQTGTLIETDGA